MYLPRKTVELFGGAVQQSGLSAISPPNALRELFTTFTILPLIIGMWLLADYEEITN